MVRDGDLHYAHYSSFENLDGTHRPQILLQHRYLRNIQAGGWDVRMLSTRHGVEPVGRMDQPRDFFVEKTADAVAERLARMHGRRVRILDLEAAAEYLSLSEDAVKDLVGAGKLSVVRPTRKIQFDVYDLDELIESLKSRREL